MFGFDPFSFAATGLILAGASGCPAPPDAPTFDMQVTQNQTVMEQSMTAAQITAMKSGEASYAGSRDQAIMQSMATEGATFYNGLTHGVVGGQMEYNIESVPVGNGQSCVYPKSISLSLTYSPTVYIAAEYSSRPCAYQIVEVHENAHIEGDMRALDEFAPQARSSMQSFIEGLGGQGPYPEGQEQAGAEQVRDAIQSHFEGSVLPTLASLRERYAQVIDTPENYKYQATLCPAEDWMPDGAQ